MERIIHLTVPEKITTVQARIIERARMLHSAWEVKVWQDPVQPDGYLLERYWPNANSGAQFADLLRLDVVYKWGGVYIDSDLLLLKPLDDLVSSYEFFVASEDGENLTNAVIGAAKDHPALRRLIEELLSNEPDWSLPPNQTTGPVFFARVLKWEKDVTVLPRETFYSYNWNESHLMRNHHHSYGEHLWAGSWKAEPDGSIVKPNSGLDWKSTAKRVLKPALDAGLRFWHGTEPIDHLARATPRKHYIASGELVVHTIHGFNIVFDAGDCTGIPELIFDGSYKLAEVNFAKRILRGGDWMLDVGVNVGFFCMLAAQRVGSFGRIFAYEPDRKRRELTSKSVVMNLMNDRVVMHPKTVGEVVGNAYLTSTFEDHGDPQIERERKTDSSFVDTNKALRRERTTKIAESSVTLDQEFPTDLPIKLLKIDLDGHEHDVLRGARRLLERRCIDFILIKVPREAAESPCNELLTQLKWLSESNYATCTLAADGSLIEHRSVTSAIDRLEVSYIVLKAQDQYGTEA
jgi:FkbM family methyltransferase